MKNAQHIITKINAYLEIPDSSEPVINETLNSLSYTWPEEPNTDPYPCKIMITQGIVTVDYTDQSYDKFNYSNDTELDKILYGICLGIFLGDDSKLAACNAYKA